MKICNFYEAVLNSLDIKVSESGYVLKPNDDQPFKVGKKDVVLPQKVFLDKNDWSELHPFHPLCEDTIMGQSSTMHFLQAISSVSFSIRLAELMQMVLTVASNNEMQKATSAKGLKVITEGAGNCTVTNAKAWKKIITKLGEKPLVKIYLMRNEKIDGKSYKRAGRIYIPILDRVSDTEIMGVTVSRNTADSIYGLLEYIAEPFVTEIGSNEPTPYFDTMLQLIASFTERYNEIVKAFAKVTTLKPIDLSWTNDVKSAIKVRKHITQLPGNAGTKLKVDSVATTATSAYDSIEVKDKEDIPWSDSSVAEASVRTNERTDPEEEIPQAEPGSSIDDILNRRYAEPEPRHPQRAGSYGFNEPRQPVYRDEVPHRSYGSPHVEPAGFDPARVRSERGHRPQPIDQRGSVGRRDYDHHSDHYGRRGEERHGYERPASVAYGDEAGGPSIMDRIGRHY